MLFGYSQRIFSTKNKMLHFRIRRHIGLEYLFLINSQQKHSKYKTTHRNVQFLLKLAADIVSKPVRTIVTAEKSHVDMDVVL